MEKIVAFRSYSVTVPGSIMLFGEHAVLYGKLALVAAIDKYITAKLIPRKDDKLILNSNVSGTLEIDLKTLERSLHLTKWRFVLTSIWLLRRKLKTGFNLEIKADFSDQIGFGSSAAATVATLAVLEKWLEKKTINKRAIFFLAKNVICKVQGVGSGADVAASVFGGILAYRLKPFYIEKLPFKSIPLSVIYSGSKTPTPEVVAKVSQFSIRHKQIFKYLYEALNQCSLDAKLAIKNRSLKKLGEVMNIHQGLQDALGVSNEVLAKIIFALRSDPNILGAKISGAGLGDSVIGLGKISKTFFQKNKLDKLRIKEIRVNITVQGMHQF
jgi:mevalonate kinase